MTDDILYLAYRLFGDFAISIGLVFFVLMLVDVAGRAYQAQKKEVLAKKVTTNTVSPDALGVANNYQTDEDEWR